MAAAKRKLTERVIRRALLHSKNKWTPREAAEWSGIGYRTLLRLFKEGLAPCIPVGPPQDQQMAESCRRRACSTYLVPRVAFQRWFENIGCPPSREVA
jgi:hypothetical protein